MLIEGDNIDIMYLDYSKAISLSFTNENEKS